jgi:energy-coupling factor transporter ATP-binding protein EcfA2
VQAAIRTLFASATVLTIAHRIATVADSDAILVMDRGHVAEFGSPAELLARAPPPAEGGGVGGSEGSGRQRGHGAFRAMVDRLGPEAAAEVEKLAAAAAAGKAPAASPKAAADA